MGRKKKAEEATDNVVMELTQDKPLLIVIGKLGDEHCNYGIQLNEGATKGMVHKVQGKPLIVHDDMRAAFQEFRAHMAVLCGAFDFSGIESESFEEIKVHRLVDLFQVTGFSIKGAGESESISLTGSYYSMPSGGRIEVSATNFVSLEGSDEYRWYNELRDSADKVRREIELYNSGKCTPAPEENQVDKRQLSIVDEQEEVL